LGTEISVTSSDSSAFLLSDLLQHHGRIKFGDSQINFKSARNNRLQTIDPSEIEKIDWMRVGNRPTIRIRLSSGLRHRFSGFAEKDFDEIKKFALDKWSIDVDQIEQCIKGWNYGKAEVKGQVLEFEVDDKLCFEIPLSTVSNCTAGKSEAALEFHQNDDCPISLMEMRFHIPTDPDADEDVDPVEEFRRAVMQYAGIETETDQPVAILQQILCTTPRGRYDIKVYQNYLSLHGKTYDYKIPIRTIMRLFLLPHKDGRHMYFVISLNPPIRQGQTRYHFLVLEFSKDEEVDLDLGLTSEQLKEQYKGKLEKRMSGTVFEVVSKIFRVMVDMKITVPGSFVGHSGTPAVMCAHKQASGFLYPLEKGFVYVHKPPMYIRFEEISCVNFARSDVSTRSFDFEIEMKGGSLLIFNSVEKEEYNRLFDFVNNKHLRIKNAKRLDKPTYTENLGDSDEELDPYKETLKQEARNKEAAESDDDTDSEDRLFFCFYKFSVRNDYDIEEDLKKRKRSSSEESGSEPDEEYDSDVAQSSESGSGDHKRKKSPKPKKKDSSKSTKGTRREKKKKDPNAPKKPQSAYFIWFGENYSSFKKEGVSVTEAAQRAGKMWKEIDDDIKKKYEERAKDDKERYAREMKEYVASGGPASSAASTSSIKKFKKPKPSSPVKSHSKPKSKEYISDTDSSNESKKDKEEKESKSESDESSNEDDDS
uniref:FACT complex subunit SSRP1 n=1 Tax=Elaeophora elaphi TaxID=1147741 RepID=A0A0R3S0X8_9BILA